MVFLFDGLSGLGGREFEFQLELQFELGPRATWYSILLANDIVLIPHATNHIVFNTTCYELNNIDLVN